MVGEKMKNTLSPTKPLLPRSLTIMIARHLIGVIATVLDSVTFLSNIDTTTTIACELSLGITSCWKCWILEEGWEKHFYLSVEGAREKGTKLRLALSYCGFDQKSSFYLGNLIRLIRLDILFCHYISNSNPSMLSLHKWIQ